MHLIVRYRYRTPVIFLAVKGSREMLARFGFVMHLTSRLGKSHLGIPTWRKVVLLDVLPVQYCTLPVLSLIEPVGRQ